MQGNSNQNPKPFLSPKSASTKNKLFADLKQRFPGWQDNKRSGPEESKELNEIKQRAIEVEKNRVLRTEAATKIQAAYRGHLDRLRLPQIMEEFYDSYRLARLEEIKLNLIRSFAPSKIYHNMIRHWGTAEKRNARKTAHARSSPKSLEEYPKLPSFENEGITVDRMVDPEDFPEVSKASEKTHDPAKVLKKSMTEDPKSVMSLDESMCEERTEKTLAEVNKRSSSSEDADQEKAEDEEPKAPFHFQKRKSSMEKPSKTVPGKIQSLLDEEKQEEKASPAKSLSMRLVPQAPSEEEYIDPIEARILELEKSFLELENAHISTSKQLSNRIADSVIPQFIEESAYIENYTDDVYRENLSALEQHYKYLCSEDNLVF